MHSDLQTHLRAPSTTFKVVPVKSEVKEGSQFIPEHDTSCQQRKIKLYRCISRSLEMGASFFGLLNKQQNTKHIQKKKSSLKNVFALNVKIWAQDVRYLFRMHNFTDQQICLQAVDVYGLHIDLCSVVDLH